MAAYPAGLVVEPYQAGVVLGQSVAGPREAADQVEVMALSSASSEAAHLGVLWAWAGLVLALPMDLAKCS